MGSLKRTNENGMVEIQTRTGWKYENAFKADDLLKDDIVYDAADKILDMKNQMKVLNAEIRSSIDDFIDLMAEQYNVKVGGTKGGVSLSTIDGRFKLQLSANGKISLDDTKLSVARELINEFLDEITKDTNNQDLKVLVNSAFRTDAKGSFKTKEILALRKLNISNEKWLKAMEIIADGIEVTDGRPYLKLYESHGDSADSKLEMVGMDFSVM